MDSLDYFIKDIFPDITNEQYDKVVSLILAVIHDPVLQKEVWSYTQNKLTEEE